MLPAGIRENEDGVDSKVVSLCSAPFRELWSIRRFFVSILFLRADLETAARFQGDAEVWRTWSPAEKEGLPMLYEKY